MPPLNVLRRINSVVHCVCLWAKYLPCQKIPSRNIQTRTFGRVDCIGVRCLLDQECLSGNKVNRGNRAAKSNDAIRHCSPVVCSSFPTLCFRNARMIAVPFNDPVVAQYVNAPHSSSGW